MTRGSDGAAQIDVLCEKSLLLLLGTAALHVQSGKHEIARLPAREHPLPHCNRKVAVLVLEVVAEYRHKTLATELLDDVSQVSVRLLRRTRGRDVIEAERDGLDALRVQARHLGAQSRSDVRTDRRNAVNREGDLSLQAAVGRPCLGGAVVARDVVRDEVEIGGDNTSTKAARLGDVAPAIGIPFSSNSSSSKSSDSFTGLLEGFPL